MTDTASPATCSSTARVPTASASRYLQQLCKHWAHNLAVEFDEHRGRVTFPRDARGAAWAGDAVVGFLAEPEALICTIEASEPGQRDGLKGAVARHLDRFAFREAPLAFDWIDG
ncbi:DUF2218 domain-containing protein [Novosphingobium huizhouense]|uniref:DUF2218 domain-containing protein n=1 Tax=Novosphingobium huizhouense TaxID=2866625 RepID=UPI001CD8F944|nr:DUF2218 domain-containing protein [Novosphingobium huizhouense]